MKGTTKSNGQKDSLDRFYTSSIAVQECLNKLDLSQYNIIIEPSAGRGAFSSQIPHCIAYDVDGKASFDLSESPSSNYFVKNTSNFSNEELIDIINNTVFDSITNTVGPKSLSKGELIETLEAKIDK